MARVKASLPAHLDGLGNAGQHRGNDDISGIFMSIW